MGLGRIMAIYQADVLFYPTLSEPLSILIIIYVG